jgi:phosphosulfolactate synthase
VLREKLDIYRQAGIQPFIGGQFHEYVFAMAGEQALPKFIAEAIALGFQAIEISDNVVPLTPQQRRSQIQAAVRAGLIVFGEVGSKDTKSQPRLLVEQADDCFARGAALVLVEAAELIEHGQLIRGTIDLLTRTMDLKKVMIELPGPWINDVRACDIEDIKKQLISCLGPDVNLANVAPLSIIDTEATRVGLGAAGPPKK